MNTINWLDCAEIEVVPGRLNGQPTIKGHRIRPETIVDNYEAGSPVEEIIENYPSLSPTTIERILAFYFAHQPQSR